MLLLPPSFLGLAEELSDLLDVDELSLPEDLLESVLVDELLESPLESPLDEALAASLAGLLEDFEDERLSVL